MSHRRLWVAAVGLTLGWCVSAGLHAQDVTVSDPQWFLTGEAPDQLPKFKRKSVPEYPEDMRKSNQLGYAVVALYLDASAKVRSMPIGATHQPFARAMEDGYHRWTFTSGSRGGQPEDTWVWVSAIFNPASASPTGPDATPRLLRVAPVVTATKPTDEEWPPVVYMKLKLDATGALVEATPENAALPEGLEKTIAVSLRSWHFAPARAGGQPVSAEIVMPVICQPPAKAFEKMGTPPIPIKRDAPEYPVAMYRSGLRGEVIVKMTIDVAGEIENPVIVSSNNRGFDEAALRAVLKWKFKPAQKDGKPMAVSVQQKIEFEIPHAFRGGKEAFKVGSASRKTQESMPEAMRYDVAPKPRGTAIAVYPYELLRKKVRGKTEVVFLVDANGRVSQTKVLSASDPAFGLAMVAAVETFQFDPALKDGRPTQTFLKMKRDFSIHDEVDSEVRMRLLRMEEKTPEKILGLRALDAQPKPLSQKPATFPRGMETLEAGEALIEFLIDEDGRVRLPRVTKTTAPAFGYAAMQAISEWRFEPPKKDGKPVVARVSVPMVFSLEDAEPEASAKN